MKGRITIRSLVKELLENENLIVNYIELNNGGFDLSVRIDEEAVNTATKMNKILDEQLAKLKKKTDSTVYVPVENMSKKRCPHCGSKNTKELYGTATLPTNGKAQILTAHFICQDCMTEFDVESKESEVVDNDR